MDQLKISKEGGPGSGFTIDGFPGAELVVELSGPKAQRLAHLALHRGDLLVARDCLQALAAGVSEPVRGALWISALVHYFKCFGDSKARFCLDAPKIYAGNSIALEAFEFFKNMRNKHYVHDENPFLQSVPGAIINRPLEGCKVAKVVTLSARSDILYQDTFTNVRLLIEEAERWVIEQYTELCDVLTKELESMSHEEIRALPNMKYTKPEADAAGASRKR